MSRWFVYPLALLATGLIAADLTTIAASAHRVADGLTGFRPQILLAATGMLGILLAQKRSGLARAIRWGLAAVIIHQLYCMLPLLSSAESTTGIGDDEISVSFLSFNVLHSNQRTEEVTAYIRETDPDVLTCFESIKHWPEALRSLRDTWPHHVHVEALDMEMYSKHPIASQQTFRFGECRGFVVCDLMVEETPVTVIMLHTYPPITFGELGYAWRNAQLKALGTDFAQHADPLVILGDFNASPWSPAYRELLQKTGWKAARKPYGVLGTQALVAPQTPLFAQPIDHLLVNAGLRVLQSRVGPYLGSDHRPLFAVGAVKARGR